MKALRLPRPLRPVKDLDATTTRQITIIGANGSGKSRFMEEMTELCGDRAYCLNALEALYSSAIESTRVGSIDVLYRDAVRQQPYLRPDAVSQLDKIFYMLFADELENLLSLKEQLNHDSRHKGVLPSRLDKVQKVWEKLFPGNRIVRKGGRVMFSTGSGDDLIPASKLSQGEKAVLYYLGGVTFAMKGAIIFIDSPTLFIHPSILGHLWDTIEEMRPDCTFIYNSVDVDFVTSRSSNTCLWVKSYDSDKQAWDYDVMKRTPLSENLMVELAGSRKPVLFVEGDDVHSIDIRLYSLVFHDRTVRPLGSCEKVIETTRTFNDLTSLHHLSSMGIVDRDRRTEAEVDYLRNKQILVPDVAEIENIFLLPEVVKVMGHRRGKDADKILRHLKRDVIKLFRRHADEQALHHTRHKIKRDVECRIDARFSCITAMETHIKQLVYQLQPRAHYNKLRKQFFAMVDNNDYYGILRVFNHKPMLPESNIHGQLGYRSPGDYIAGVLDALKGNDADAERLRHAVLHVLHADIPSQTEGAKEMKKRKEK